MWTQLECRPCSCQRLSLSSSQLQSEKWGAGWMYSTTGAGAATTGAGVAVMMQLARAQRSHAVRELPLVPQHRQEQVLR